MLSSTNESLKSRIRYCSQSPAGGDQLTTRDLTEPLLFASRFPTFSGTKWWHDVKKEILKNRNKDIYSLFMGIRRWDLNICNSKHFYPHLMFVDCKWGFFPHSRNVCPTHFRSISVMRSSVTLLINNAVCTPVLETNTDVASNDCDIDGCGIFWKRLHVVVIKHFLFQLGNSNLAIQLWFYSFAQKHSRSLH